MAENTIDGGYSPIPRMREVVLADESTRIDISLPAGVGDTWRPLILHSLRQTEGQSAIITATDMTDVERNYGWIDRLTDGSLPSRDISLGAEPVLFGREHDHGLPILTPNTISRRHFSLHAELGSLGLTLFLADTDSHNGSEAQVFFAKQPSPGAERSRH